MKETKNKLKEKPVINPSITGIKQKLAEHVVKESSKIRMSSIYEYCRGYILALRQTRLISRKQFIKLHTYIWDLTSIEVEVGYFNKEKKRVWRN